MSKRQFAVNAVWECLSNNQGKAAFALYKHFARIHGRRLFGYWCKLSCINDAWLEDQ